MRVTTIPGFAKPENTELITAALREQARLTMRCAFLERKVRRTRVASNARRKVLAELMVLLALRQLLGECVDNPKAARKNLPKLPSPHDAPRKQARALHVLHQFATAK